MVGDAYTRAAGEARASQPHQKVDHKRLSIQKEVFQMSLDPNFPPVIKAAH